MANLPGAVALLLVCHGLLLLGSLALGARQGGARGRRLGVLTWVRAGQIYFASAIALGLVLGWLGCWTRSAGLGALAGTGCAFLWWGRSGPSFRRCGASPRGVARLPAWLFGGLALVISWVCLHAVVAPRYEYDALTYHLTFPALWIQRHALPMIPTWFGDPSPSYAPLGTEVWYGWLMLATRDDLLARCGQLPFWLLLLGSVSLLAHELGVSPVARRATCLAVALTPALSIQAGAAMVDVALVAHTVCVVLFALRLARRRRAEEAVGLALALALLLSTKYLALAFAGATLPVVGYALLRALPSLRKRGAFLVLGSLAFSATLAAGWYARNAVLTGNPIYPMEVRLGPVKLWDGAYGRSQMENSSFNLRRRAGWPGLGNALERAMFGRDARVPLGAWMPALAGALFLLSLAQALRSRNREALLVAATALLALAAFWWGSPFQQPRFAWSALVLLVLVIAGGTSARRRGVRAPRALQIVGLVTGCVWAGACLAGPWWRDRSGMLVLGVSAGVTLCVVLIARLPSRRRWTAAAAVAAPALLWCAAAVSPDPRAAAFASWPAMGEVWSWLDEHARGATIAYTGDNVPYFLLGRRFENRALHVPACSPPEARFDEYARSSAARALGPPNTSEPTPHRYEMRFSTWLQNLRAARVDYVLVHSLDLFPNLLLNVQHDAAGFPVERGWLDALTRAEDGRAPIASAMAFARGAVYLYRLDWSGAPPGEVPLPAIRNQATDAIGQLAQDGTPPGQAIRGYPHARALIERQGLRPVTSR